MATLELTAANIDATIAGNDIVLIDWWAAWCGPCRAFAPVFEAASQRHPQLTFGKIDTEAEQELSSAAGIASIPTLMVFREGILVFSQPGALPAPALEELIGAVGALDMDEVRTELAAQAEDVVES